MRRAKDGAVPRSGLDLSLWMLAAVAGLIPLVILPHSKDGNLAKPLFIAVGLSGAMLILAVCAARGRLRAVRWTVLDAAVVAFAALTCVSYLYSDFRHAAADAIRPALLYTLLYLSARLTVQTQERCEIIAIALLMGCAATCVVAIIEQFGLLPWARPWTVGSTWFNRVYFAAHLLLVVPLGFWALLGRGRALRILGGISVLLGGLALVLTGARIAWVALFPMSVAALVFAWPAISALGKRRAALSAAAVLGLAVVVEVCCGAAIPHASPVAAARRAFGNDASGSNAFRKALMIAGLRVGLDHPVLGAGAGTYGICSAEKMPRSAYRALWRGDSVDSAHIPSHAHNEFLEVFAELGGLGLAVYILTLVFGWTTARRALARKDAQPSDWVMVVTLVVGCVGYVCANMVDPAARVPGEGALFYLVLAMIAAAAQSASRSAIPAPAARSTAALILGSALLLAMAPGMVRQCAASRLLARGETVAMHYGAAGMTTGINLFRRACRLTPTNAEPHYSLGNALAMAGRYEEALAEYRVVERLWPHYGRVHFNKATCYAQLGLLREAESEMRLAYWQDRLPDSREALDFLRRANR